MTKEEFKPIAQRLRKIYTRDNFLADKETFDLWFEFLEDLETRAVERVVNDYIKANPYPPTIADIRQEYQVLLDGYNALLKRVKDEFELAMSCYPEPDATAYDLFLSKIKEHPQKEWIPRASSFKSRTIEYVRQGDINRIDFPGFKDYINEQTI